MSPLAIGIDVAKDKLDVAVLLNDQTYRMELFTNNKTGFRALYRWLKKYEALSCPACLESTGRYGEGVAEFLYDKQIIVSIVNAAQVKLYAQSQLKRNKTDREDAKVIAHFCWTQQPRSWQPPSSEIKELQALSRHLQTLKEDRTRLKNRQKSGVTSKLVLRDLREQIVALNKRIKKLEIAIKEHIDQHPTLKEQHQLLTSIPGIGEVTAALVITELPDVTAFNHVGQVVAYAGLSPRISQSGASLNRRGGIVKTGNKRLRTGLYMPALIAVQHNPIIKTFAAQLTQRGKPRMAVIGAAMRKLLHLIYGILKHKQPFDPNHLQKQAIGT